MSENNNLSDKELLLKVAGNESKALEELYDRYSPVLFTLISKIVQEKSAAEEILSDIFVIIWQKIDLFDSENIIFKRFDITHLNNTQLTATAYGEKVDRGNGYKFQVLLGI